MKDKKQKVPKVRMSRPGEVKIAQGRKIELRYTDVASGKEIRISTGTMDESEALDQKRKLEAKLLLGIDAKPAKRNAGGPTMDWQLFRNRYRELQLIGLREDSREAAEVRLNVAERIVNPTKLADMANAETLHELQAKLLAGEESTVGPKDNKRARGPRSPQTVKSYITAVLTALNWAQYMEWLPSVPKVRKVKVSKLRQMKGRAIKLEEFERILEKVKEVVGDDAEPSWSYLLRGLWESGLRIEELMHLHWSDEQFIVPQWKRGALPVLAIPAAMQKNDTEEFVPMLPWLEDLLLETPEPQRFGWCFNPMSLQVKLKRRIRHQRANAEWIGKVITRIGESAGVIVRPKAMGKESKFASAHDLRRSFGERMALAGVPEREIAKVLRHADVATTRRFYAPGSVQDSAGIIRDILTVPRNSETVEST